MQNQQRTISWGDDVWQLQIDSISGALVQIQNRGAVHGMNWLREAGRWEHRNWLVEESPEAVTLDGQWGLVETAHSGLLHVARVKQISERAFETVSTGSTLTATARRELNESGDLCESYTFHNTGVVPLDLPVGALAVTAPFFDQYPDAGVCLSSRCHAHLWMGGSGAWIHAMRMGTQAPHLGLVVTQGSLDAYSQRGATFNDRGVFLLHPSAMTLAPGESQTLAWKLFWHTGWDDFFSNLRATPNFVRLSASRYTVSVGQPLEIAIDSQAPLEGVQLFANDEPVEIKNENGQLSATVTTTQAGPVLVELRGEGRKTWLRANVTPSMEELLASRLQFIVRHQQRNAPGDALDGAYLSYDNETGEQIYEADWSDHNAGRERVGMGVLGALYLPMCRDEAFKSELQISLSRYAAFVARELEDEAGVVYSGVGRRDCDRLYNCPWVASFHLALYRATGETEQLDRFVRVLRSYYERGGAKFYAIGIPIFDGLKALERAGRTGEHAELLAHFRAHADQILQIGANYPRFEVNYEQSIVAPAVQILAEMFVVTGESAYFKGTKQQMPLLEAFCGKQPDFRLNEVALRHWDDYWFGKWKVYGDTLPHYWSVLNAVAYAFFGRATGEHRWFERAHAVLGGNLALFNPDGSASCAHVYPLQSNGQNAARNDPWANDQDWALVHWFTVRAAANSV